jgi:hypothetical protein
MNGDDLQLRLRMTNVFLIHVSRLFSFRGTRRIQFSFKENCLQTATLIDCRIQDYSACFISFFRVRIVWPLVCFTTMRKLVRLAEKKEVY